MNVAPLPITCPCYSLASTGEIRPVLCSAHEAERLAAEGGRGWRYKRYFDTESDAADRKRIIYHLYPGEAYGTTVQVSPVGRWWLVLAWWGSAD